MSSVTQPSWTDDSTTLLRKIAQSLYDGAGGGGGLSPQTGTNAQKLGGAWSVGQEFHVTDGFVVSGTGTGNDGLRIQNDVANGKPAYIIPDVTDFGDRGFEWDGLFWEYDAANSTATAIGNTDYPWEADWSGSGLTLTHPAVQTLAAPSTAQGGVFVSGGTQDGVYTSRGTQNSKDKYNLLGQSDGDPYKILWVTDGPPDDATPQWWLLDSEGTLLYYSLSDVATPDLASNVDRVNAVITLNLSGATWNASDSTHWFGHKGAGNDPIIYLDANKTLANSLHFVQNGRAVFIVGVNDSPDEASVIARLVVLGGGTVVDNGGSSITITLNSDLFFPYDLNEGVPPSGITGVVDVAGSPSIPAWRNASDDTPASITVATVLTGNLVAGNKLGSVVRAVNGATNGRNKYTDVLASATDLTWDGTKWTDGTTNGSTNTAFPDIGTSDPVASESNWSTP